MSRNPPRLGDVPKKGYAEFPRLRGLSTAIMLRDGQSHSFARNIRRYSVALWRVEALAQRRSRQADVADDRRGASDFRQYRDLGGARQPRKEPRYRGSLAHLLREPAGTVGQVASVT